MKTSRWSRFALVLALVPVLALALIPSLGSADAPVGQYTVATATVTDKKTHLVWQRVEDGNVYTWANAKTHCASLNAVSFGGFSTGWRIPTIKELQTIVDDEVATTPTIDPVFTGTVAGVYWSTTPVASTPSAAWYVPFDNGSTDFDGMTNANRVRCVR